MSGSAFLNQSMRMNQTSQTNLLPTWQPRHGADIKSVLQGCTRLEENEYQWDVLNLTEGFESTLKHCLHYLGPALLASNSQLNKYGYEVRFIDKSWWTQPRCRKLAMKYCYSEEPRCPIVKDVMKWFVLPKQVCSLITLLMLLLLHGFVVSPLPSGNTQPALRKKKAITCNKEMTAWRVKTNLGVCYCDCAPSFTCICKPYKWRGTANVIVHSGHDQSRWVIWGVGRQPRFHPSSIGSVEQVSSLCSLG